MIHGPTSGFCPIFLPRCRQSGNSISRAQDSSTGDGERKTLHFISTSDQNETLGFPFPPFPVVTARSRDHSKSTLSVPLITSFLQGHLSPFSRCYSDTLYRWLVSRQEKGPSDRISCGDLSHPFLCTNGGGWLPRSGDWVVA